MDICQNNDVPTINDKYIDKQLHNKSMTNDMPLRLTLFYDNQRTYIHLNNHVINISIQSLLCSISHSTKNLLAQMNNKHLLSMIIVLCMICNDS